MRNTGFYPVLLESLYFNFCTYFSFLFIPKAHTVFLIGKIWQKMMNREKEEKSFIRKGREFAQEFAPS